MFIEHLLRRQAVGIQQWTKQALSLLSLSLPGGGETENPQAKKYVITYSDKNCEGTEQDALWENGRWGGEGLSKDVVFKLKTKTGGAVQETGLGTEQGTKRGRCSRGELGKGKRGLSASSICRGGGQRQSKWSQVSQVKEFRFCSMYSGQGSVLRKSVMEWWDAIYVHRGTRRMLGGNKRGKEFQSWRWSWLVLSYRALLFRKCHLSHFKKIFGHASPHVGS